MNSPIISTLSRSDGSEVNIIHTQHVSAPIGTLGPFVGLAEWMEYEREEWTEVTVPGASLEISDVDLCLGTGPLFDFGALVSTPDLSTFGTTTLTNTAILNTTSSSAPRLFTPHPKSSQSVIGCSIAESTNHFAGSATLNVNHTQHFSAINTTVMACHDTLRSNDDISNTKDSTRPSFCSSTTGITRCLFTGCFSTYSEGAAISLDSSNSVAIAECSFADCFCSSASTGIGGAVFVDEHSSFFYDGPQTTITKSSVANCRAHWGSGVCLRKHKTVTISEFVVENCSELEAGLSSKKTGLGALLISNTDESVCVSNSLFSHFHNDHAGSIFLNGSLLQNTFNCLAFRGSSVEKGEESRDFATTLPSSADLALMFSSYDSTSFGDAQPFVAIGTTDSSGNLTITKSVADLIACVPTAQTLQLSNQNLHLLSHKSVHVWLVLLTQKKEIHGFPFVHGTDSEDERDRNVDEVKWSVLFSKSASADNSCPF
ncbi:hypothetical protein BLNAU_24537 [Blattamonas nauphoetae]|uniref:Right handed beta helix domain-containing protein n=1 Tax=Blattamonas nauphoetae TaxID=2049346 RepID=A0ABQ9WP82_9EUKA|nr:hypothetical protein BLNAU_24537 [Blattamonas nauphoetae]